jgi:cytochrome c peroxidase
MGSSPRHGCGSGLAAAFFSLALAAAGLSGSAATERTPERAAAGRTEEPITPLPTNIDYSARSRLGERLFHDPRLSRDGRFACSSCHRREKGGADGERFSLGLDGQPLEFNTPTIFNVGFNFRFNWRGNFRTLEDQNEAALLDPRLMNDRWDAVLATIEADPDYGKAFADTYEGSISREHVLDALTAYEESLVTPNARFDQYLRGEHGAITSDEEHGYQLFKSYGCVSCHQGANVGGNLFQKFGIFADPFAGRPHVTEADLGRFAITGNPADRHVFRVPSLRNVALTAPYLHDGSAGSLEDAVDIMARNQLGLTLAKQDVALIVEFLRTLTGEFQGHSLAEPAGGADR